MAELHLQAAPFVAGTLPETMISSSVPPGLAPILEQTSMPQHSRLADWVDSILFYGILGIGLLIPVLAAVISPLLQ
ncbi:MAG: hypothetical protein R3F53_24695 [Gammaproteobacteria bacterium]